MDNKLKTMCELFNDYVAHLRALTPSIGASADSDDMIIAIRGQSFILNDIADLLGRKAAIEGSLNEAFDEFFVAFDAPKKLDRDVAHDLPVNAEFAVSRPVREGIVAPDGTVYPGRVVNRN